MSSLMMPQRPGGGAAQRRSLTVTNSRAAVSRMRTKFAVSYEALLSGDHPWLTSTGASGTTSLSGTPLPSSSMGTSSSSSSSLTSPSVGYFSATGKKPSAPRSRFFADLLCLKVEPDTLYDLVQAVPARALVEDDVGSRGARIRDNIGSLWRECLRVWTDVPRPSDVTSPSSSPKTLRGSFSAGGSESTFGTDEVRRQNALETLIVLSKAILSKTLGFTSSSLDLIWIFAGGIDEADEVFEALVNAIDDGLRGQLDNASYQQRGRRAGYAPSSSPAKDNTAPPREVPTLAQLLFHRQHALHLAIIWISQISASNLSAYFVRRDLFAATCSLLTFMQTVVRSAKAQTGAQGLADEDVALLRSLVRDVALLIGLLAGLGQGGIASGAGIGAAYHGLETTFSPYFRRMCDWVDQPSMLYIQDALAHELRMTWTSYEEKDALKGTSSASASAGSSIASPLGLVTAGLSKITLADAAATQDIGLPPPSAANLLPIFLLIRANQAFMELVMRPPAQPGNEMAQPEKNDAAAAHVSDPSFSASLLSLSSYLATHGSLNDRSKTYSRLSLLIFLMLISSPAGVSALVLTEQPSTELSAINECKQRSGPLPMRMTAPQDAKGGALSFLGQWSSSRNSTAVGAERRRLLPFVLDCCVQYMRHNLRKRLDTSGYLVCLQVVHLSIEKCAQRRMLLEYSNWPEVWRAINSTAAFLAGRHAELRGVEIGKLGCALLGTLSGALVEADRFLQSKRDVDSLVYEMVRSGETLQRLAAVVTLGRDGANGSSNGMTSSSPGGDIGRPPSRAAMNAAVPGWQVLDSVLTAFEERLRIWTEKRNERSTFGLPFTLGGWTESYFGKGSTSGTNSPAGGAGGGGSDADSRPSSSAGNAAGASGAVTPSTPSGMHSQKNRPGVQTVMELVASLDLEHLVQRGRAEQRGANHVDEAWIERAETQCLVEAFRYAAEDMRTLIASPSSPSP